MRERSGVNFYLSYSFEYYAEGVIPIMLSCIGIMINFMGIFFMSIQIHFMGRRWKIVFFRLMIFLAVWDMLTLILLIFTNFKPKTNEKFRDSDTYKKWGRILLPMTSVCITGSIYTTIALTLDRYLLE